MVIIQIVHAILIVMIAYSYPAVFINYSLLWSYW